MMGTWAPLDRTRSASPLLAAPRSDFGEADRDHLVDEPGRDRLAGREPDRALARDVRRDLGSKRLHDVIARRKEAVVALVRRERDEEVATARFETPACRTRSSRRRPARQPGSSVEAPRGSRGDRRGTRRCTHRQWSVRSWRPSVRGDAASASPVRARSRTDTVSRRAVHDAVMFGRRFSPDRWMSPPPQAQAPERRSGRDRVAPLEIRRPSPRRGHADPIDQPCRAADSARHSASR